MGIELPAELAGVAERAGVQWPEADEDALLTQAVAWRDTAQDLRGIAADADASASDAVSAMEGDAGDQARRRWAGLIDADSGVLITAAQGAEQAADRLEHAAHQVGEGKVEIVRQLTDAARNEDAANAAAAGGHPEALLGVPEVLGAASANTATVTDAVASSVADTATTLDTAVPLEANPGGSGRSDGELLAAVTGLPAQALPQEIAPTVADPVEDAVDQVADGEPVREVADGAGEPVREIADGVGEPAREITETVTDEPSAPVEDVHELAPDAPTPPAGLGPPLAEAVTPRAGTPVQPPPNQTTLAGFAPGGVPPAAGVPAGPAPSLAPQPAPPPAAPPFAGGGPAPGAPAPAPAGGGPPGGAGPQGSGGPQPPRGQQPNQRGSLYAGPPPPPAEAPSKRPEGAPGEPRGAPGEPRRTPQEANVVAMFTVHMFPIGHLPVATSKPARQLPPPEREADPFAPLCFGLHDHPRSDLFDDAVADPERAVDTDGLAADDPALAELFDVYDPLGGMHEREWDRRFLVKDDPERPEYAWPPGAVFPEGCYDEGEPVVLEPGTVLDRFGDPHGRVFAPAGVPHHERSLPPAGSRYRRYRVVQELPMWQGTAAPWFGQPGGGVRYRGVYPARDLVVLGFLADITHEPEDAEQKVETGDPAQTGEAAQTAETGDTA